MTWPLVLASALLLGQLRLLLGPVGLIVPCAAFAWTQLVARRSERGSFVATALLAACVEGPTFDAPFAAAPFAAIVVGITALGTRRLFPVRGPRGEVALGVLFAAMGTSVMELFQPESAIFGESAAPAGYRLAGWIAGGLLAGVLGRAATTVGSLRAGLARR